jgi:hypothetical protein
MVDRHDIFFGPGRSTFWIPTIWTTIGSTFAISGLISITAGAGEKFKLANLTDSAKSAFIFYQIYIKTTKYLPILEFMASLGVYVFSYVFLQTFLGLPTKINTLNHYKTTQKLI